MELTVRGLGKDHGEKVVAKRDLATAKVGRFDRDQYEPSEIYITPEKLSVDIRFDAKIILNGTFLARLALDRKEIANLFFLLYADSPLEEFVDQFNAIRALHERGPLPRLPFDKIMLKKVDGLELSVRAANCLRNDNIIYIGNLVQKTEAQMLRTPNYGHKGLNEIKEVLAQMGLHLGMEVPGWPPENIEEVAKRFEDFNQD